MMSVHVKVTTVVVALPLLAAACATRGQLRRAVEQQRTALAEERTARMAADSGLSADIASLRTELASLRTDLQGMRTEFGAKITALEESVEFALPVHFAFDEALVRPEDRAALDRFAQVVQRHYGGAKLTVEGFADPAGTVPYNLALSRRRADAVRTYLMQTAALVNPVDAVGYGESRQVVPGAEKDAPGAELNRRVVFVIESPANSTATKLTAQALLP
jgi:peptidoglycan-associated lipoprotein